MKIKVTAPKANERQIKQLEEWLMKQMIMKTQWASFGMDDLTELPVIMRRVAAKEMRERHDKINKKEID